MKGNGGSRINSVVPKPLSRRDVHPLTPRFRVVRVEVDGGINRIVHEVRDHKEMALLKPFNADRCRNTHETGTYSA